MILLDQGRQGCGNVRILKEKLEVLKYIPIDMPPVRNIYEPT